MLLTRVVAQKQDSEDEGRPEGRNVLVFPHSGRTQSVKDSYVSLRLFQHQLHRHLHQFGT